MSRFLWIIDAGHGPLTPGKRSPRLPDGTQLLEWEFNYAIASAVVTILKENGIDAVLLSNKGVKFQNNSLNQRIEAFNRISGKGYTSKVLVSIHGNAFGDGIRWTSPHGAKVYYHWLSDDSLHLASVFLLSIIQHTGMKSRGVKPNQNFYLLKKAAFSAILTENGFYTHFDECAKMMTGEFRDKIVKAHVEAAIKIENSKFML